MGIGFGGIYNILIDVSVNFLDGIGGSIEGLERTEGGSMVRHGYIFKGYLKPAEAGWVAQGCLAAGGIKEMTISKNKPIRIQFKFSPNALLPSLFL